MWSEELIKRTWLWIGWCPPCTGQCSLLVSPVLWLWVLWVLLLSQRFSVTLFGPAGTHLPWQDQLGNIKELNPDSQDDRHVSHQGFFPSLIFSFFLPSLYMSFLSSFAFFYPFPSLPPFFPSIYSFFLPTSFHPFHFFLPYFNSVCTSCCTIVSLLFS